MRIISQDGTTDVPYENVIIAANGCYIGAETPVRRYPMAVYSDEEKTQKVMESMREEYMQYLTARSNDYFFSMVNPKVFQFPEDNEVRVDET